MFAMEKLLGVEHFEYAQKNQLEFLKLDRRSRRFVVEVYPFSLHFYNSVLEDNIARKSA